MHENWLLAGGAYEKIILTHHIHFQSFSSVPPVTHSSCLLLLSLSNVQCPLSHVSTCLSSHVLCLTSLFLVSHPLAYVSRRSTLPPVHCPQSYFSVPCLSTSVPCFTSLFLVSCHSYPVSHDCPLSPILLSLFSDSYPLTQCPLFCGYILILFSLHPFYSVPCVFFLERYIQMQYMHNLIVSPRF
jgi:hypothetical protein